MKSIGPRQQNDYFRHFENCIYNNSIVSFLNYKEGLPNRYGTSIILKRASIDQAIEKIIGLCFGIGKSFSNKQ